MRKCSSQIALFLVVSGLWAGSLSAAVQVEGLYEVEVPVSNQARDERKRALRQGLADLITRLTGSQALEQFGQFLSVLDRASSYVEQYRYRTGPELEPGQKPEFLLWVRFNRKAIQKLLREQQLPMWGSTRPETLVWIAYQDQGERHILAEDQASSLYRAALTHARRRGVPVLLPLMDLEDQRNVGIGDIWGGFAGTVKTASIRYATENILIGRVYPVAGGWESRWTLISKTGEQHWSGTGRQAGNAIAVGFDGLGDLMASRYAQKTTYDASRYHLKVAAVNSLKDYAKASRYLANVSLITRFQPVYFTQGNATYEIEINGTIEGLEQVLKLEQRLLKDDEVIVIQPQPVSPSQPETVLTEEGETLAINNTPSIETLYYRLRP